MIGTHHHPPSRHYGLLRNCYIPKFAVGLHSSVDEASERGKLGSEDQERVGEEDMEGGAPTEWSSSDEDGWRGSAKCLFRQRLLLGPHAIQ